MAQWSQGTASINNGSATVNGVGTAWLSSGALPGLSVFVLSGVDTPYLVSAISSDTVLTLQTAWEEASASDIGYVLSLDATPRYGLPLLDETDVEVPALINRAFDIIDAALP